MKNIKSSFEIIGFFLGTTIGSLIYLSYGLEKIISFSLDWDIGLAGIIGISLGCGASAWLFLFLCAKIGQLIGLLITFFVNFINLIIKT